MNYSFYSRGSMYTGLSNNPSVNHHTHKKNVTQSPQVGFAIIPVTSDKANPKPAYPLPNLDKSIQHSDIQKIVDMLNKESVNTIAKSTNIAPSSPLDNTPSTISDEANDKTLSAMTTTIGAITVGLLLNNVINKVLNMPSAEQRKILAQREMTNDIIKAVPNLLQATTTGIAMLAGTIGAISWLNQKTPERLRAEYDILSKH